MEPVDQGERSPEGSRASSGYSRPGNVKIIAETRLKDQDMDKPVAITTANVGIGSPLLNTKDMDMQLTLRIVCSVGAKKLDMSCKLFLIVIVLLQILPIIVDSADTSIGKSAKKSRNKELYIGGIFPMTGGWAGGKGCRPAVDMALEDVNSRPNILPGYTLELFGNDSKCMPGLGMNVMYELLYNKPTKLMLLGPGCSVVSTFVGQAARMWNLIVLSYGSSSPALSDRKRFPTFFRTHPSATLHNPTRVTLFKKFNWNKIATIQETQEVFTSTIEDLEERVKNANIEIAVRTSFLTDPTNAVRNLKRQGARIIVGLFYENMARRVFCEVYKQKLYGPKQVWFIIGWYPDNWYAREDENIDCTPEQMKEALQGHITTEGLMLNPHKNLTTISGMTAEEFQQKIEARIAKEEGGTNPLSVTGYVEAPLAYDAVWALALALNKTQTRLVTRNQSLEQFDYSNHGIMEEIYSAMNATDFDGVSGKVAFNSEGDRIAWTQIEQMWDGNYTVVGLYDFGSDNLVWFNNEKWYDDKIPQDRTRVEAVLRVVSPILFIAMCLLASIGIITAIGLIVFNTMYQNRRHIKLSQPHINSTMCAGCVVCFCCIYLHGLDGQYLNEEAFKLLCQVRAWVLSIGFTLAYGSMFSKVWTIYRLTTRRKKEIKLMKEWEMYLVLTIFLVMDFIVLISWQVIDPLTRELEFFPNEIPANTDEDIEIQPQLEHCSSEHLNIWLGVIFGYKGVLLLFGILLAYETRNVKVKQVNDSKFVGMSIYNVVVLCIITAPVTLIIGSHQDGSFAFVAVAILLSSFLAMGLIFVPKILDVVRNPREGLESAALTDSNTTRDEEVRHQRLLQENDDLKTQIAEKEERIQDLNRRMQQKTQGRITSSQQNLQDLNVSGPGPGGGDIVEDEGMHSLPLPSTRIPPLVLENKSPLTLANVNTQDHEVEAQTLVVPSTKHTVAFAIDNSSDSSLVSRSSSQGIRNTHGSNYPNRNSCPVRSGSNSGIGGSMELATLPTKLPDSKYARPHPTFNINLASTDVPDIERNSSLCKTENNMDNSNTLDGIAMDPSSDSALPTSSTAKSSKTSALSDEHYSESYC